MRLRYILAWGLSAVALSQLVRPALAQNQPLRTLAFGPVVRARAADCNRVIAGDSVALYYNAQWELTPIACATQRLLTHLEPDGSFHGEVRDYDTSTDQLLYRQHYQHGKRTGKYEAFYPNGQRQVSGSYEQGEPVGEWQWWYASGRPMQTLRRDLQAPQKWRFIDFWDESGQQLVANGTGRWQQQLPHQTLRIGGPVLHELPDGEWQLVLTTTGKVLTKELFEQGLLKKGHDQVGGLANYRDRSHLLPAFDDPSPQAERLQLGATCAEAARLSQEALAERERLTRSPGTQVKNLKGPHPDGDGISYLRMLLEKMEVNATLTALRLYPQYEATVEADVDGGGKLSNFQASEPQIQRVFSQLLPTLGRWYPATVNKLPATSRVRFKLYVLDQHWQAQWQVVKVNIESAAAAPNAEN